MSVGQSVTLRGKCDFLGCGTKCLIYQPCDVIKMRVIRGEVGKKTPKIKMDNPKFLWRHSATIEDRQLKFSLSILVYTLFCFYVCRSFFYLLWHSKICYITHFVCLYIPRFMDVVILVHFCLNTTALGIILSIYPAINV